VAALRASAGVSAEIAVRVFSFFAIVTSFLGVALGCVDFVADVLKGTFKKMKQKSSPKVGADNSGATAAPDKVLERLVPLLIMISPALVVAVCAPTAFLPALEYSGTLRLILFGMMPALMVWKIRHGGTAIGGG
jgi:tyrosine-specific transport protein